MLRPFALRGLAVQRRANASIHGLLYVLFFMRLCVLSVFAAEELQHVITASIDNPKSQEISAKLFLSLERTSRLVDIAYCVGNSGISPPFSCVSRCKDFPSVELVATWNTGLLMTDSCGYIAVDDGTDDGRDATAGLPSVFGPAIIVAFRGTYSITNTIIDLSTVPQEYVPYPAPDDDGNPKDGEQCNNCTVHMGFLTSWRNARDIVLPALKAAHARHPTYPIHIMGHSLGGAVAALAALDVKLGLGWTDVQVTTFGEPRVGNDGLVAYIDTAFGLNKDDGYDGDLEKRRYRRVTHADDPVPLLPPTEWGYRAHAGELFVAKVDLPPDIKDLRVCRGDQDPQCSIGADSDSAALMGILQGLERDGVEVQQPFEEVTARNGLPTRLKLWELLFAHRDYFWRLGLCVPGGDPIDWGRDGYNLSDKTA
jgi:hypothetical protein